MASSVRCNQGSDRVQTDHDQQTHRKISEISCGSGDLLLNTYVQAAKCVPSLVYINPCYSRKQQHYSEWRRSWSHGEPYQTDPKYQNHQIKICGGEFVVVA